MGKHETTTKEKTESQGVCEKMFKALSLCPSFRSSRRKSPVHPQTQSPKYDASSAATNPTVASTDHHRNYPAKSTISKPVALHQPPAQNGSTISHKLNGQHIPLHEKDQNMVLVEYNHSSGDIVNKSPMKNMVDKVHNLNDDPKVVKSEEYNISSDRFTKYIDHVKNKLITMSSFDDDDEEDGSGVGRPATRRDSFIDHSNLKIRTTTIIGGN